MKKFLAIAAIAATTLVACNNDGESTETTDSTTTINTETTIPVTTDTSSLTLDSSSMNTTTIDTTQN